MKIRRVSIAFLVLTLFSLSALGATSVRDHFISKRSVNVLPTDSMIGQTADPSATKELTVLSRALSEEFSFEWTETYLEENTRTVILDNMTNILTSLLPQTQMVFSKPFINGDSSVSINVRFMEKNMVLSFVLSGEKIVAMALK